MHFELKYSDCRDMFSRMEWSQIHAIAHAEDWRLPDIYLEFLAQHNGITYSGRTAGKLLVYQRSMDLATDEGGLSVFHKKWPPKKLYHTFCGCLDQLYGFSPDEDLFDIRRAQTRFGFSKAVPADFVAIGGSGLMTSLVLCLAGDWRGMIFHWTPPADPTLPEECNTLERLQFVANDFSDLWRNLVEVPIRAFRD